MTRLLIPFGCALLHRFYDPSVGAVVGPVFESGSNPRSPSSDLFQGLMLPLKVWRLIVLRSIGTSGFALAQLDQVQNLASQTRRICIRIRASSREPRQRGANQRR